MNGAELAAWWALPFAGVLLSIALCPLLVPFVFVHDAAPERAGWALALLASSATGVLVYLLGQLALRSNELGWLRSGVRADVPAAVRAAPTPKEARA